MSRLTRLMGKSQTFEIGGESFTFTPFTVSDMSLFTDLQDEKKQAEALRKLIFRMIKQAVPEATDDEIDRISVSYFKEFVDALLKVNGLDDKLQGKTQ